MTTAKTYQQAASTLKMTVCSGVLSAQPMKELRQRLAAIAVFFTEPSRHICVVFSVFLAT